MFKYRKMFQGSYLRGKEANPCGHRWTHHSNVQDQSSPLPSRRVKNEPPNPLWKVCYKFHNVNHSAKVTEVSSRELAVMADSVFGPNRGWEEMGEHERIRNRMRVHYVMRGERTAASGHKKEGAVGETWKMRVRKLNSKARSKCWLTHPFFHTHTNTHFFPALSQ